MLPTYIHRHKKYDRFLPFLVSKIRNYGLVVDVGANVGDTLVAMATNNPNLQYLCLEPDWKFFQYLELNSTSVKEKFPETKISLKREFVGINVNEVSLTGKFGTKHATSKTSAAQTFSSKSLDSILEEMDLSGGVILLKSDVDGFDWDVLDSSINAIKRSEPILFFEVAIIEGGQIENYKRTLKTVQLAGYDFWYIFDNFGQFIFHSQDLSLVFQMLDYLEKNRTDQRNRTIFYFDILVSTNKDRNFLSSVVDQYEKSYFL
jgi:FkbM family methyltransferase